MSDENERDGVTQVESTEVEQGEQSSASRRQMLSAAVKFTGIMAALGLSGQALLMPSEAHAKKKKKKKGDLDIPPAIDAKLIEGPGKPGVDVDGEALQLLLAEAFDQGSMAPAIAKHGPATKLPPMVLEDLAKISDADIAALATIRNQLAASLNGIAVAAPWTVHEHATYRQKD